MGSNSGAGGPAAAWLPCGADRAAACLTVWAAFAAFWGTGMLGPGASSSICKHAAGQSFQWSNLHEACRCIHSRAASLECSDIPARWFRQLLHAFSIDRAGSIGSVPTAHCTRACTSGLAGHKAGQVHEDGRHLLKQQRLPVEHVNTAAD